MLWGSSAAKGSDCENSALRKIRQNHFRNLYIVLQVHSIHPPKLLTINLTMAIPAVLSVCNLLFRLGRDWKQTCSSKRLGVFFEHQTHDDGKMMMDNKTYFSSQRGIMNVVCRFSKVTSVTQNHSDDWGTLPIDHCKASKDGRRGSCVGRVRSGMCTIYISLHCEFLHATF